MGCRWVDGIVCCHSNGTGVTTMWTTGCQGSCGMVNWLMSCGTRSLSVMSSRWKTTSLSRCDSLVLSCFFFNLYCFVSAFTHTFCYYSGLSTSYLPPIFVSLFLCIFHSEYPNQWTEQIFSGMLKTPKLRINCSLLVVMANSCVYQLIQTIDELTC